VLDGRDPFSVTLPLGYELWGEADVVGVGTRLFYGFTNGASTTSSPLSASMLIPDRERFRKPAVIGDAKPILRRLIDALGAPTAHGCHAREMLDANARAPAKLAPKSDSDAIRAELGRTAFWSTR
jgi:acetolactate synthase-1/2/3 large subunit